MYAGKMGCLFTKNGMEQQKFGVGRASHTKNFRKVVRIGKSDRMAGTRMGGALKRSRDAFRSSALYKAMRSTADRVTQTASKVNELSASRGATQGLEALAATVADISNDFRDIAESSGNEQSDTAATWMANLSDRVSALTSDTEIDSPIEESELSAILASQQPTIDALANELAPAAEGEPLSTQQTLENLKSDLQAFTAQNGSSAAIDDIVEEIDAQLAAADGVIDISNITTESGRTWTAGATLEVGEEVYSDRGYTFTDVGSFAGATLIQTANDDKKSDGDNFAMMEIDQHTTVYVAYDTRESEPPSWLQDWEDTGEELSSTDVTTLRVYKKEMAPGTITLGGTEQTSWGRSNYSVFVTSEASDLEATLDQQTTAVQGLSESYEGEALNELSDIVDRAMGIPQQSSEVVSGAHQALLQISERLGELGTGSTPQEIAQETFTRLNNLIGQIQEMDGTEDQYETLQGQLGTLDSLRSALEPHVERSTLADSEKKLALEVVANEMKTVTDMLGKSTGSIKIPYESSKPKEIKPHEVETLDHAELGKEILSKGGIQTNILDGTLDPSGTSGQFILNKADVIASITTKTNIILD